MVTWAVDGVPTLTTPPVEVALLNGHAEHLVISLDTIIQCGDVDTCLCTSGASKKGVGIGSICEMHQSCGVKVEVRWEHIVSCGICTHVLLHWVPL